MPRLALALAVGPAALASLVTLASCSKSASKQEPGSATGATAAAPTERIAVPGGAGGTAGAGGAGGSSAPGGNDAAFRLQPDEGQLAIELPADAKAGVETTAHVVVTPGPKYKVNVEFPTKLTLDTPAGVTLAKAEWKAGGADKAKGDAEQFDDKQLRFAVKLTPTASGTHTINGSFKFAVCDKDQCLAKKEPISIELAAK